MVNKFFLFRTRRHKNRTRGAKIPCSRSPEWRYFVRWSQIYVAYLYGTCFMSAVIIVYMVKCFVWFCL